MDGIDQLVNALVCVVPRTLSLLFLLFAPCSAFFSVSSMSLLFSGSVEFGLVRFVSLWFSLVVIDFHQGNTHRVETNFGWTPIGGGGTERMTYKWE